MDQSKDRTSYSISMEQIVKCLEIEYLTSQKKKNDLTIQIQN